MLYSLDFRKKVMKIKEKEKLTYPQTAQRFDIGITTVVRWGKRIEPLKVVRKSRKIDMDLFKKDVEENLDSYQRERAKKFNVSKTCIYNALKRLKVTYKKNSK